jgi:mannan endo-1,4-beta-mannosidase
MKTVTAVVMTLVALATYAAAQGDAQNAAAAPLPKIAFTPANPNMSPEARKLMEYMATVPGRVMLPGVADYSGWESQLDMTGRMPSVYTLDFYGYHTKGSEAYDRIVRGKVAKALRWSRQRGGILAAQIHWGKPGEPDGIAWKRKGNRGTGPADVAAMVTPGTDEHKAAMADMKVTADYLQMLADAKVPIFWRPLHEIDGGWFWWTDTENPKNTAALYRMMFDYFTKERKLNNLIWVFNSAHVANSVKKEPIEKRLAYRKAFYPGNAYVDVVGMDVYGGKGKGWGLASEQSYGPALQMMQQIAPGKMVAMCEGGGLPNPDLVRKEKVPWLYCLSWWTGQYEYLRSCYSHDYVITLDELPVILGGNVSPNVRIATPVTGKAVPEGKLRVEGVATDRNDNLTQVSVHMLRGPWLHWGARRETARAKEFKNAKLIGKAIVAQDGRWHIDVELPASGYYTLAARAEDADGLVEWSNVVLLSRGLQNMAKKAKLTASSKADDVGHAVDNNPFTTWTGDKKGVQWLAADLGRSELVGAVVIVWTKAYSRDYEVQVSEDGVEWDTVAEVSNRRKQFGDTDVLRFDEALARHVRIWSFGRATTWGGIAVKELGIFEDLPKLKP